MIFSVRTGHVFRKPCLIAFSKLADVGLKSAACEYWASYGLDVFAIIFFTTVSGCCVPRGTSHITVFLFLVPLIFSFPFFCIFISCLSSVMVHPSLHKTYDDIDGDI